MLLLYLELLLEYLSTICTPYHVDHYLASTTYAGPTSRCTTGALHRTEGCALLTVLLTVLRSAGPGGRPRLRGHQRGGFWVGRGVGAGARYAWLGSGLGLGLGLR